MMTQENIKLLIKDLCGRLPYGIKFRYAYIDEFFHKKYGTSTLEGVLPPYRIIHSTLVGEEYLQIEKDEVKPYLFPLSYMTKEQEKEYESLCIKKISEYTHIDLYDIIFAKDYYDTIESIDWLNKNHFDYRGLIKKGLAIDATGLNIY